MLDAIGTYQCGLSNQSGLTKLEYLPTAWVDKNAFLPLISSQWNWQMNVPLINGGAWLTMQVQGLHEKQLWTETERRDLQGKYYMQSVTAQVPNLLPSVSRTMDRTSDYRYLIRLTDKSGQKWLLGTLDTPFDFQARGTTGGQNGLKHHAISFESITKHKAYGFHPVL